MNEKIESFYPKIGQTFFDFLPSSFVEAWLNTEMLDDVWGTEVFFLDTDGKRIYKNENLENLEGLLLGMRSAFKDSGKPPFSTATFWLDSSGKFSIDFGYEDVSDFGMDGERRKIWMKKYLKPGSQIIWE